MLAGNSSSEALQPLRLCLAEDVTHALANRWVFLRHHSAGGHLQQRNKIFPHYCAYGKAQTVWPRQSHKGRFLWFLFEQAVISWLHLIFIRFWNSSWAVFPSSWQEAPGYVIPCDRYLAPWDHDRMFWSRFTHSYAEAAGWAGTWGIAFHPGHLQGSHGGEKKPKTMRRGGTQHGAGWFYCSSLQWGGEGSQDVGFRGDSRTSWGSKVHCTFSRCDSESCWTNKAK